jgi:hypothetical protein
MTGETEVVKLCFAFFAPGDDVVYDHWITRIGLSGLTIGTTVIVRRDQLLAEFRREVGAHIAL